MKLLYLTSATLAVASWGIGCDSGSPDGSRIAIGVAPLTLPGTAGIEYALAVFNDTPDGANYAIAADGTVASGTADFGSLVWNEPSVTSNQYGNGVGGDISYVGTCDATNPHNWVALVLKQVAVGTGNGSIDGTGPSNTAANSAAFVAASAGAKNILDDQITTALSGGDGDADFENPCPYNKPCVLRADCDENKDTEVEFNLTVMRDAEQGFFDIAVNFEDVFCSAKADSCYALGDEIELLFGADGRHHTFVAGFACTAGPDYVHMGNIVDVRTQLLLSDPKVTCDEGFTFTLDLDQNTSDDDIPEVGNNSVNSVPSGKTLRYATYSDVEMLACGQTTVAGTSVRKPPVGNEGLFYEYQPVGGGASVWVHEHSVWDESTSTATSYWHVTATASWADSEILYSTIVGSEELPPLNITGENDDQWTAVMVSGGSEAVPLPCNKRFYNIAIDIEDLATQGLKNCTFAMWGTAQDAYKPVIDVTDAALLDGNAVYGGVGFNDVPLTNATPATVCDAHPLDGKALDNTTPSKVKSFFFFGDAYGKTASDDGYYAQDLEYYMSVNEGMTHIDGTTPLSEPTPVIAAPARW